ncbi:MAG TPA: efflux RND transporter periplasmic adaptor subunit [Anaerolineae bacterium]
MPALSKISMRMVLGLIVIVLVVLAAAIFLPNRPRALAADSTAVPTVVVLPTFVPVPTTAATAASQTNVGSTGSKGTGTLQSVNQANLAFGVGGRIKTVSVKEGDRVKTGDVLASLDTTVLETQVLQAQALLAAATAAFDKASKGPTADDLALAKANLDLTKAAVSQAQAVYDRAGGSSNPFIGLLPQSLALQQASGSYQAAQAAFNIALSHPTTAELAAVAVQVAQAQLALDQANQTITNAKLIAPIDGTVVSITPHVGESASVGGTSAIVADLSQMQVVVNVGENALAGIRVGQPAAITVDALGGKALTGRVKKIGLLGTSSGGLVSVPVTVLIDPSDALIYPGLSANVTFQGAGQ